MKHELTCIRCPIGCQLTVDVNGDEVTVTGNSCPRGAEYGKKEVTAPTRIVTSSVRVSGGAVRFYIAETARRSISPVGINTGGSGHGVVPPSLP